jgi:hypothetical protein
VQLHVIIYKYKKFGEEVLAKAFFSKRIEYLKAYEVLKNEAK